MHALLLPLSTFLSTFRTAQASPRACRSLEIPQTFSEAQAGLVLALKSLHEADPREAHARLQGCAGQSLSVAQAACAAELLRLSTRNLHATLADAMAPSRLRTLLLGRAGKVIDALTLALLQDLQWRPVPHAHADDASAPKLRA